MQNETFFLTNFYNNFPRQKGLLKTESTDFIVQEIYENEVCTDKPKVNFDIILLLDTFLYFLEKNEGLTLLEVKNNNFIFDRQNFTFNLQKKENLFLEPNFNLSETEEDEELKEKVFDYLNKLTFKEYSFICTDKQLRKEVHDFLKPHPFIFTYCDGIFFKVKTCLIQNYSFILKKMNKDTSDIKNLLENNLQNTIELINKELEGKGILTNEFLNNYDLLECDKNVVSCKVSFSGNKDKKALTYQRMNVKCNFINLFNASFFNLKILDIKRSNKSLNLGELNGNKFIIKIRKINELENQINNKKNNSIINLENSIYFLNYFGMQRFGKSKNNHLIGELIHQNKIKEALDCILFTCFNARKERDSLIDLYNEKKYDDLLKLIPRSLFVERKILFLLKNNTKDILKRLPRESLMLFLHAYQSYIFNEEINKVISKEEVKVYIKKENEFILSNEYEIKDAYLKLPALNNKLAKGTYRKVLGLAEQVKVTENESEFVVEFILDKGCYATMFLRELFDLQE